MDIIIDNVDSGYKDTILDISGVYFLWNKLVDYATYWEEHSPTVNGNPDYNTLVGLIQGFLIAKRWRMTEEPTKIIIRTSQGRLIIEMTKRPIPQHYFDKKKEIAEAINKLLGY